MFLTFLVLSNVLAKRNVIISLKASVTKTLKENTVLWFFLNNIMHLTEQWKDQKDS